MTQPHAVLQFHTTCVPRLSCSMANSRYRVVIADVQDPGMPPGVAVTHRNLYLLVDDQTEDAVPFQSLTELRQ
jgi:hypothetical protein